MQIGRQAYPFTDNQDSVYPDATIGIDLGHHRTHDGRGYWYEDVVALGNGASQVYQFNTPTDGRLMHFGYEISFADGAGLFEMYEASDRTPTTIQTLYNRHRTSTNVTTATLHKGVSAGTTDGTRLCYRYIGSGRDAGASAGSSLEYVLKANTKYLIRCTNQITTTNNLSVQFDWYEI
jgi:hypothetical protein